MNKKLLFLSFLCVPLVLSGCNNGGSSGGVNVPLADDYYKEYTFSKVAEANEKEEINENCLSKTMSGIKAIKINKKVISNSEYSSVQTDTESTYIFHQDSSKKDALNIAISAESNSSGSEDGITMTNVETTSTDKWDTYYGVIATANSKSGEEPNTSYQGLGSVTHEEYCNNYLGNLINLNLNSDYIAYQYYRNDDGGYTVLLSGATKDYSAQKAGESNKEYVKVTKYQTVFKLDSNYKIVSGYSYTGVFTNRDTVTKAWYNEVKNVSVDYVTYEFTYGSKTSRTIDSLNTKYKVEPAHNFNAYYNDARFIKDNDEYTLYENYGNYSLSSSTTDLSNNSFRLNISSYSISSHSSYYDYYFAKALMIRDIIVIGGYQTEIYYQIDLSSKLTKFTDLLTQKEAGSDEEGDTEYYYVINQSNSVAYYLEVTLTYKNGSFTVTSVDVSDS